MKMTVTPTFRAIELSSPDVTEAEIEAVCAVLRTHRLSLGPKVPEFEQQVAEYIGSRYAIAVNSGTSALHLIVRALGLGEGDEVITTPFSFIASANCLLYERVKPVFVDIDPETFNLDPARVEAAVTPRTKAILAVDVFGRPAAWPDLRALAHRYGLALIEDSCEALGARAQQVEGTWEFAGRWGDAGCFAFYPNKQITTGEGGIIVTDREDIAVLCRSMRNQGRDAEAGWLQHVRLGYNYRLSDINCALGIIQLQRIEEILAARRQVARWYQEAFADGDGILPPRERAGEEISWFVYVVRLLACRTREQREYVLTELRARGIGCNNYFSPIHLQPFYRQLLGHREGDFPITEYIATQTVALPFYNHLQQEEVVWIAAQVQDILTHLPDAPARLPETSLRPSL